MKKHDFSMVLNNKHIRILKRLEKSTKKKNTGGVIAYLVILMQPYFNKRLRSLKSSRSTCTKVNWSKKIHVRMDREHYHLLKLLHKNLDTYSIAAIVREMLDIVFYFYEFHGDLCFEKLELFVKNMDSDCNDFSLKNGELPQKFKYIIVYNKYFEVSSIFLE